MYIIHTYLYISRNMGGQSLRAPTVDIPRLQQSRASGAVNLTRYGRFCDGMCGI